MNEPTPDDLKHLTARVSGLEEILTHFERTVGELDEVLRHVQTRMNALESRLETLTRNAEHVDTPADEERSLEDERPPHY